MSHTPGPWAVEEEQTWPFGIEVRAGGREVVSLRRMAYSTSDESLAEVMAGNSFKGEERERVIEANARQMADAALIAAAPELLACLSEAVNRSRRFEEEAEDFRRTPELQKLYERCVVAIAKATGS